MTDTNPIAVGNRLRAAMALRGWSGADLARLSGLSRQTIWRYMTGRSPQNLDSMARIARLLDARLEYLAYGSGEIEHQRNGRPR